MQNHLPQDQYPLRAWADIDIAALKFNIQQIRRKAGNAGILAVIKADAYGHGLENITASIWPEVDGFAVATIKEGIQCRQIQSQKPVVVLSEFWHPEQLQYFEIHSLDLVIHNLEQLPWLLEYRGSPLSVWIKFDTGMNRLGINPEDVYPVYGKLKNHQSVKTVRLISHLANADIPGDQYTVVQQKRFESMMSQIDCEASLANTAAVMKWRKTHYQWVRPGILLYGVSPFQQDSKNQIPLKQVMSLTARIIAVKNIEKGSPVGYGGVYVTEKKAKIAMVGIGYGDGYPRVVGSKACVIINGAKAPIIGNISMDMITIDVTDLDVVMVGDQVELWGNTLPIEKVAEWAGTIPYELLCKVTPRIPRFLINT